MTMKLQLIENWNKAHKMFVMWALSAASALQLAWLNIPAEMRASVPAQWVQWVTLAILLLGGLGRLVRQPGVDADGDGFPDTQPIDHAS